MAPGTIYRRAVRRVDRRAKTYNATHSGRKSPCTCQDYALLSEAVRTANRLAFCAGVA